MNDTVCINGFGDNEMDDGECSTLPPWQVIFICGGIIGIIACPCFFYPLHSWWTLLEIRKYGVIALGRVTYLQHSEGGADSSPSYSVTYSFSNKRGNSYKETFAIDSQRYHKLKVGDVIDILYDPKYNKSVIPPTQVFGVYGDDGYTWRFVPNERIAMLKLEKIVDPELHADTKQEKAQKIIDAIQSSDISSNKLEIDKLKGYTSVKDEKK